MTHQLEINTTFPEQETAEEYFLRLEAESCRMEELSRENEELKAKLREAELKDLLKTMLETATTEVYQSEHDQKVADLEREIRRLKKERDDFKEQAEIVPPPPPTYAPPPGPYHQGEHQHISSTELAYDPIYGYEVPPGLVAVAHSDPMVVGSHMSEQTSGGMPNQYYSNNYHAFHVGSTTSNNYHQHNNFHAGSFESHQSHHEHNMQQEVNNHYNQERSQQETVNNDLLYTRNPRYIRNGGRRFMEPLPWAAGTSSGDLQQHPRDIITTPTPFSEEGPSSPSFFNSSNVESRESGGQHSFRKNNDSNSTTQSTRSQETIGSSVGERRISERSLVGRKLIEHLDSSGVTSSSQRDSYQRDSPDLNAVPENMMVIGQKASLHERKSEEFIHSSRKGSEDSTFEMSSRRTTVQNLSSPPGMNLSSSYPKSNQVKLPALVPGSVWANKSNGKISTSARTMSMPAPPPGLENNLSSNTIPELKNSRTMSIENISSKSRGWSDDRKMTKSRGWSDDSNRSRPNTVSTTASTSKNLNHSGNMVESIQDLTDEDLQKRSTLYTMCEDLDVEYRTIEWFVSPCYSHLWPQMINKIGELEARKRSGAPTVKNPAAWLTKFFNIIRVDPDEPERNRAMRNKKRTLADWVSTK